MTFVLGPRAARAAYRIRDYDSLDSTNSEALRLAREGERGPLWIVTREQTAGRGRRGREWLSSPDNLATSLLFAEAVAPQRAATLGFAASLAVCQACREVAAGIGFAVKWPNDVLANGSKVAGILLESEAVLSSVHSRESGNPESWVPAFAGTNGDSRSSAGESGILAIVTGFGINVAQAPDRMPFPATSLERLGKSVMPEVVFGALSDAFADLLAVWKQDFAEIRRLWLENAKGLGEAVSVRIGERIETGIFETLDEQGRMMLRKPDGAMQTITAGDVFFGNAASAGPQSSGAQSLGAIV